MANLFFTFKATLLKFALFTFKVTGTFLMPVVSA